MTSYLTSSSPRQHMAPCRRQAFAILDACRTEYGQAFDAALCADTDAHRSSLLRATRRYRLVTWVLCGIHAAHQITAWRAIVGERCARAERRAS